MAYRLVSFIDDSLGNRIIDSYLNQTELQFRLAHQDDFNLLEPRPATLLQPGADQVSPAPLPPDQGPVNTVISDMAQTITSQPPDPAIIPEPIITPEEKTVAAIADEPKIEAPVLPEVAAALPAETKDPAPAPEITIVVEPKSDPVAAAAPSGEIGQPATEKTFSVNQITASASSADSSKAAAVTISVNQAPSEEEKIEVTSKGNAIGATASEIAKNVGDNAKAEDKPTQITVTVNPKGDGPTISAESKTSDAKSPNSNQISVVVNEVSDSSPQSNQVTIDKSDPANIKVVVSTTLKISILDQLKRILEEARKTIEGIVTELKKPHFEQYYGVQDLYQDHRRAEQRHSQIEMQEAQKLREKEKERAEGEREIREKDEKKKKEERDELLQKEFQKNLRKNILRGYVV